MCVVNIRGFVGHVGCSVPVKIGSARGDTGEIACQHQPIVQPLKDIATALRVIALDVVPCDAKLVAWHVELQFSENLSRRTGGIAGSLTANELRLGTELIFEC